MGGAIYSQTGR
ncbi:hypothetical protein D0Y50_01090 [Salinimonas sediminis]|uniref:Uncharacterized protein n=1 Tax=Salinimonas sediminis TaxID=2303538 RepID=A0A346NS39_9ALTE|nr:hypothetical protein D0Y50_01090 [Salinimonas sediminis]